MLQHGQSQIQDASADKISSSAHQREESLGVAASADTLITFRSLDITSFTVGLFLGSCWMHSWTISQITSSSSFLKDFKV